MQRRSLLQAAAASTLASVLVKPALAAPALAQPASSRVLRFIPQADVTTLDPLGTTSYAVRNHGHLCWDTLYEIGRAHV